MKNNVLKSIIIEDDILDTKLIKENLSRLKTIKTQNLFFKTLNEGVKYLKSNDKIDLILLDLSLPDSKGLDTLKEIIKTNPNIPVIVLSNITDERTLIKAIKNGADDYLIKSNFDINELEKTIKYSLERKKNKNQIKANVNHLKILRECNQVMLSAKNEETLLKNICKILIEIGDYDFAFFALKKYDKEKSVETITYLKNENTFLKNIKISWDYKKTNNPVSEAIRTGEAVICNNINDDAGCKFWQKKVLKMGYNSSISAPLKMNKKIFGTINIFSKHKNYFSNLETDLLLNLSSDLAKGIKIIKERIEYQEKIQTSEQRFRKYFEIGLVGMLIYKNDWSIIEANNSFCNMLGYSKEEIKQYTVMDLTFKEDINEDINFSKKIEKNKIDGYILDKRFINKYGEIVFTTSGIKCIKNCKGEIEYFIALVHDITNNIHIEKRLNQSRLKYKNLFENAADAIFIMEKDKFKDCNNKATELLGAEHNEIIGKTPLDFSPELQPDGILSAQKAKKHIKNALKGENEFFEWVHLKKDGTKVYCDVSLNSFSAIGSDYILSIVRDISFRKKMEIELHEKEERFKSIFNFAAVGIILESLDNEIIQVNNKICEMLNYSERELLNFTVQNITYNEDIPKNKQEHEKLLNKKIDSINIDKRFISKNGKTIWANVSISLINDINNEPLYFLKVVKNITEKKNFEQERENLIKKLEETNEKEKSARNDAENALMELEAAYQETRVANEELEASQAELEKTNIDLEKAIIKAEDANKLKSEFLAIVSHELRTPLSAMLGFSQLLSQEKSLDSEHKEYVEYINRSGEKLLSVLNDIIEISIIEAGKFKIEYENFEIEEIIKDIKQLYKDKFEYKKIAFKYNLNGVKKITSDPARIRQILLNLIGNAIKFTDEGTISIDLSKDKNNYTFCITDTGIGINQKDIKPIFDVFRQVESSMSRKHDGIGLGLSICKKLVNALDGDIWVESEPTKGSKFYFSIPKEKKIENKTKQIQTITNNNKNKAKINVLFAEDDPINFKYIEKIISCNEKFNCKGFEDGEKLFNEFKSNKNKYDIIALDIQMPVMNGVECLKEIRNIDREIPIIAITAFAMLKDREKYLNLGFTDYITKPVKKEDIEKIILRNI